MKTALAVVALVFVVCLCLIATSPSPLALIAGVPAVLVLTFVVQFTARAFSRFGIGYPSQRGGVYPPAYGRLLVVALLALGVEAFLVLRTPGHPRWMAELAYYLVLAAAGVALARWCRSSEQSPVFLATGILVLLSAGAALSFGFDPIARFEYGPERWLFAVWNNAARTLTMLPLDTSVAWAAWHIAAVRGTPSCVSGGQR
jgi:hypothetical protein